MTYFCHFSQQRVLFNIVLSVNFVLTQTAVEALKGVSSLNFDSSQTTSGTKLFQFNIIGVCNLQHSSLVKSFRMCNSKFCWYSFMGNASQQFVIYCHCLEEKSCLFAFEICFLAFVIFIMYVYLIDSDFVHCFMQELICQVVQLLQLVLSEDVRDSGEGPDPVVYILTTQMNKTKLNEMIRIHVRAAKLLVYLIIFDLVPLSECLALD